MKHIEILMSGVFTAPFVKGEQATKFLRVKRQSGYWNPNYSHNQWGYTIQEQANEYWTDLRANAQYYMDMGNLVFDRSLADENNRLYMDMLRDVRAQLDAHSGQQ
ncbi:uncharacterized protein C3orf85-like [Rhinichthys klamathensis goyatoka]|uniref:uncharacterized protein C3orf85-like n=1 Tax=Rhinichthys klamathensis goyatoka TaxID=3034132 RepID=UPI0024B58DE8|nr:uncharacterized protein C3orf85-like [Rhinichthys klamathensis goyatoka]